MSRSWVGKFVSSPRLVFLLDGVGALLSAVLLTLSREFFNALFGVPESVICWLILAALGLAIYSLLCYFLLKKKWWTFIYLIAALNLSYAVITALILLYFSAKVTVYGWVYFCLEISLLFYLVLLEFRTAHAIYALHKLQL